MNLSNSSSNQAAMGLRCKDGDMAVIVGDVPGNTTASSSAKRFFGNPRLIIPTAFYCPSAHQKMAKALKPATI
jgi:hypothetical protein